MEENNVMTTEMENTTPETMIDESYVEDSGSGLGGVLLGSALTIGAFAVVKGAKWLWKKVKKSPKKDSENESKEESSEGSTETSKTEKKK